MYITFRNTSTQSKKKKTQSVDNVTHTHARSWSSSVLFAGWQTAFQCITTTLINTHVDHIQAVAATLK